MRRAKRWPNTRKRAVERRKQAELDRMFFQPLAAMTSRRYARKMLADWNAIPLEARLVMARLRSEHPPI
jgi:hypothetical protein